MANDELQPDFKAVVESARVAGEAEARRILSVLRSEANAAVSPLTPAPPGKTVRNRSRDRA